MALVRSTLVLSIRNLVNALRAFDGRAGQTQADAVERFANDLAAAIDTYIRSATVNVSVTGTATVTTAPGSAPVTGTGVGTLS